MSIKYEKPTSRDLNSISTATGSCASGIAVGVCNPNGINAGSCGSSGSTAGVCNPTGGTVISTCTNGITGYAQTCALGFAAAP